MGERNRQRPGVPNRSANGGRGSGAGASSNFYFTNNGNSNAYFTNDANTNRYLNNGIYLDPNLATTWRPALQGVISGTRNAILIEEGDSTTWGQYSPAGSTAGDQKTLSRPSQLANLFLSQGISARADAVIANGAISAPGRNSNGDPHFTIGAAWAQSNATFQTMGGYCATKANATSSPCLYTFDDCNLIRVYYPRPAVGATLTFLMDGVAAGSVNISGGTDQGLTFIDIPASGVGTHTLSINCTDATASVFGVIAGVVPFNTTKKQVIILNAGWPGAMTNALNVTTTPWSPLNAFQAYQPDGCVLNLLTNDWNNANPIGTATTNYTAIVQARKAYCDTVCYIPNATGTAVTYGTQQTYVNMAVGVAQANNCPIVNMFYGFGDYSTLLANGYMGNSLHFRENGYAVGARAEWQLLRR